MIEIDDLKKIYGRNRAVDDLTLQVLPGRVTGFVGPNGAGKSTTLRLLLGLDRPDAGRALVCGSRYADLPAPLRVVGAHLEANSAHPGRSARAHLIAQARYGGISRVRVDEVCELAGISSVIHRRVGQFSLGMAQRLGIATALLGDPQVLLLDEPFNGLDADGVSWVRTLLRGLAGQGRTILVSTHLMAELEQTADHVVVLGRGRLVADCPLGELADLAGAQPMHVRLRVADDEVVRLRRALLRHDIELTAPDERDPDDIDEWWARTSDPTLVGACARDAGVALRLLAPRRGSLERGYRALIDPVAEHRSSSEVEAA